MKSRRTKKPVTTAESKNEPTDREPAVLHERGGQRPRRDWRSFTTIDDDWTRSEHKRGRLKDALLTDWWMEAFGTACDQFANGLLHYLCTVLPANENSAYGFPRDDDLNRAISLIAAGKAVDEIHAKIFTDVAVCQITAERLLHNLGQPLRFDLSEELKLALQYYKYDPKDQIDREVKIDNRPVLEFSVRSATRLMSMCIELIAAADRHRAIVESSRKRQELSVVPPMEASLGEINHATSIGTPKKANAAIARRLNGSAVPKLPQKTDSPKNRNGNGHTPT